MYLNVLPSLLAYHTALVPTPLSQKHSILEVTNMVSPNALIQAILAGKCYKNGIYKLTPAEAQAAVKVHSALLGTRHGQSANILLLHFQREAMVLYLLHELPQ